MLDCMSELWERIKAARNYVGLSQEALGALCNPPITKAGAGLWESKNEEKRTKPIYENLKTISKETGAPLEWLLSDDSSITELWLTIGSGRHKVDQDQSDATGTGDSMMLTIDDIKAQLEFSALSASKVQALAAKLHQEGLEQGWLDDTIASYIIAIMETAKKNQNDKG